MAVIRWGKMENGDTIIQRSERWRDWKNMIAMSTFLNFNKNAGNY